MVQGPVGIVQVLLKYPVLLDKVVVGIKSQLFAHKGLLLSDILQFILNKVVVTLQHFVLLL